jgi:hypothetical protein
MVATNLFICASSIFASKLRYDERMKSIPDPDTTPAQKMRDFNAGLRQILTVSKTELTEREEQYQAERADKPKRGPKSKPSA